MIVAMKGYPEVKINRAGFEFTPAYAALTDANLMIGSKSDFALSGTSFKLHSIFFQESDPRGNLSMHSKTY